MKLLRQTPLTHHNRPLSLCNHKRKFIIPASLFWLAAEKV